MKYLLFILVISVSLMMTCCSDNGPTGPAPVINAIAPLNGNPGTPIYIAGENFSLSSTMSINGLSMDVFISSEKNIYATIPEGATSGAITIHSNGHTVDFSHDFEVTAAKPAASHTYFIHPGQRVATMLLPIHEYEAINTVNYDYDKYNEIFSDIYNQFEDDFDMIFFIHNNATRPVNEPYGYNRLLSNSIEGIGIPVFDRSSEVGSSGKLKALITMPTINGIANGPMLHEIMHTWANSAFPTEDIDVSTGQVYNSSGHWGMSGCGGELGGGFKVMEENVDGDPNKYKLLFGTNGGFSNFELYLMGLIGPDELEPFDVFHDLVSLNINILEAKTRLRYDRARIESELGSRSPDYLHSQKEFRALVLVISPVPLTTQEFDKVDQQARTFFAAVDDPSLMESFWEATKGRGQINIGDLRESLKIK